MWRMSHIYPCSLWGVLLQFNENQACTNVGHHFMSCFAHCYLVKESCGLHWRSYEKGARRPRMVTTNWCMLFLISCEDQVVKAVSRKEWGQRAGAKNLPSALNSRNEVWQMEQISGVPSHRRLKRYAKNPPPLPGNRRPSAQLLGGLCGSFCEGWRIEGLVRRSLLPRLVSPQHLVRVSQHLV